jgi:hypothetical protein
MKRQMQRLTRLSIAAAGVMIDDPEREAITALMTEALVVDVPVLQHLEASEVVTAEVVDDNQLWIVFGLAEPIQATVRMGSETRERLRRLNSEEVQLARTQLGTVEWRIREAVSEARSPFDGIANNPDESSTKAIRGRVRRHQRGGQLWIPALDEWKLIDIENVPATLARGPRILITARVLSMEFGRAELADVSIAAPDRKRVKGIPGIFRCTELERDVLRGHRQLGARLSQAIDRKRTITLDVIVVMDWVSGSALRFKNCPA